MTTKDELQDKEYRAAYAETFLDTAIATQLRVLREQRGLNQEQLAALAGMRQSRISVMEDVNYSKWNLKTLKRLATAFDLPLFVSFGSWSQLRDAIDRFTRSSLERPRFEDDPLYEGLTVAGAGLDRMEGEDRSNRKEANGSIVLNGSARFGRSDELAKIA